jgi:hypothetical protein
MFLMNKLLIYFNKREILEWKLILHDYKVLLENN